MKRANVKTRLDLWRSEATLSDSSIWATYEAWIVGGAGLGIVRNKVIEPKFTSGEWKDIHIQLPKNFPVKDEAANVTADMASQAPNFADIVQASVDVINWNAKWLK